MEAQIRLSPLHDAFATAGAQFALSHGWKVATKVHGGYREYLAVRESVGISDFSDQGKLRVRGEAARDVLDDVLTGNVRNMAENTMRMMLALDEAGNIAAQV